MASPWIYRQKVQETTSLIEEAIAAAGEALKKIRSCSVNMATKTVEQPVGTALALLEAALAEHKHRHHSTVL